jgi:hypothetical protein
MREALVIRPIDKTTACLIADLVSFTADVIDRRYKLIACPLAANLLPRGWHRPCPGL